MYYIYRALTYTSAPFLQNLLKQRLKNGKELPTRFTEKKSIINITRPDGHLVWIHAASVGEAQSALVVINKILEHNAATNILVTTGTVTSAALMEQKLPVQAIHQFAPLDHPIWVQKFLNHWKPDGILWMESELWPNMLHEIRRRNIKAFLINAHMSEKSYTSWKRIPNLPKHILKTFEKILCQTQEDKRRYDALGARNTIITDNLKYSAAPLAYDQNDLEKISEATQHRPLWLYASTHKGEEKIAIETHQALQGTYPNLLTIIVPRHPERRDEIRKTTQSMKTAFRGETKNLPQQEDQIYVADTLGELGLFYKLCPIAVIGRSFSNDGGGGHNPIEAAQLGCAVLHGPHVQNLQDIYDDMIAQNACIKLEKPEELAAHIKTLLGDDQKSHAWQKAAKEFSQRKTSVINKVMAHIAPSLNEL